MAHEQDRLAPGSAPLQTSSGLGVNCIAPATIVKILREFRRTSERHGYPIETLLPVAGCESCTVTKAYPRLSYGSNAAAVAAKTAPSPRRRRGRRPRRLRQHGQRRAGVLRGGAALRPVFVGGASRHRGLARAAHRHQRRTGAAGMRAPGADLADVRVVTVASDATAKVKRRAGSAGSRVPLIP